MWPVTTLVREENAMQSWEECVYCTYIYPHLYLCAVPGAGERARALRLDFSASDAGVGHLHPAAGRRATSASRVDTRAHMEHRPNTTKTLQRRSVSSIRVSCVHVCSCPFWRRKWSLCAQFPTRASDVTVGAAAAGPYSDRDGRKRPATSNLGPRPLCYVKWACNIWSSVACSSKKEQWSLNVWLLLHDVSVCVCVQHLLIRFIAMRSFCDECILFFRLSVPCVCDRR